MNCNQLQIYGKAHSASISLEGMFKYHTVPLFDRRCATKDCRFAHGTHELRNANTIPDNNEYTCPMWEMGRCSLGIHCKLEHCFAERVGEQKENLKTNSLDKTNEPARKVLSIDDSLPRRRLDLFPHLDFSNESELDDASALRLLPNDLHGSIGVVSILSTEGDDSPWNLPN
jgi:hypothetical protein